MLFFSLGHGDRGSSPVLQILMLLIQGQSEDELGYRGLGEVRSLLQPKLNKIGPVLGSEERNE